MVERLADLVWAKGSGQIPEVVDRRSPGLLYRNRDMEALIGLSFADLCR